MDYKYIEQLIDSYFEGTTSLEEEHILREFFAQENIPEHLLVWQSLFRSEKELASAHLDERFDERLLSLTGEAHVRALPIPLRTRLRPLLRVAAFIAFAVIIGTAVEQSVGLQGEAPANQMAVQDELDADETTALDIRSAELQSDSVSIN